MDVKENYILVGKRLKLLQNVICEMYDCSAEPCKRNWEKCRYVG